MNVEEIAKNTDWTLKWTFEKISNEPQAIITYRPNFPYARDLTWKVNTTKTNIWHVTAIRKILVHVSTR